MPRIDGNKPWEAVGNLGKPWETLGSRGKPWEAVGHHGKERETVGSHGVLDKKDCRCLVAITLLVY